MQGVLREIKKEQRKDILDNPVLDAIIQRKKEEATANNIKFVVAINIPARIAIEPEDWIKIMTNLLDNAIDSCKKIEKGERVINLELKYDKKILAIEITNSIQGGPIDFAHTSKRVWAGHGYGLKGRKNMGNEMQMSDKAKKMAR